MMRLVALLAAGLLAILLAGAAAEAQVQKTPFGVPLPPSAQQASPQAGVAAEPPGLVTRLWYWVLGEQHRLNRKLADAVKEMKNGNMLEGTLVLAFLSFAYGVLHAAGPGHGKAIISSYVLANERTLRRGIFLSFLASLIQALSAIVIVGILAIVLNATSMEIRATEAWIETVSWGFVALVGLWLLSSQVKRLTASRPLVSAGAAVAGHDHHDHVHGDDCGCDHDHGSTQAAGGSPLFRKVVAQPHVHGSPGHGVHVHGSHVHGPECAAGCGHAHMPEPSQLEGDLTWKKALAIALSVGIRPCTGAILVLIFSLSQGILLAGIFSTFAMAIGTAITVSALASIALGSRELAVRIAGAQSEWGGRVANGAGLLGSLLVFLMGTALFFASLKGPQPF